MYNYEVEKERLYSDIGFEMLIKIRDNANKLLREAGAFRNENVMKGVTGDSFMMLACVDMLVDLGEIVEVTQAGVAGQHKVYIGGKN
jgi:hypothetical protein